jgi:hypothetical protein
VSSTTLRRTTAALVAVLGLIGVTASVAAAEPSAITRWYGDASSATGNSISQTECNVNGDEYDDLIVGAWFWDRGSVSNLGAAYVLFGGPEVQGGDLQNPSDYGAARIDGAVNDEGEGDTSAFSVACLGDVNDDGLDDIGVSQYISEKVFVVLGAAEFGAVDLSLLGERGYEVHGSTDPAYDYNVGFSMSPVGDYDDDGIDDFAVSGVVYDRPAIDDQPARTNNGRVWIVAGKEDVANVDLIEPAEGEVLATIDGAYAEERLGSSSLAGDVNGDGIDDFIVGSYTSTPWGAGVAVPGQAYVVFGGSGEEIDLLTLGDEGFAIRGPQRGRDRLGISVDGAGDVNGDGLDDLLIGADGVYNVATGERPGSAWVVWGSASTSTVYTNPTAGTTVYSCESEVTPDSGTCNPGDVQPRGYVIVGQDTSAGTASESTGYSVASAGDVNGDEIPDFIIGAYGYDPVDPTSVAEPPATMTGAGAVFVVYGKTSLSTRNLATLTPTQGYRVDGLAAGDRFGRQVSAPGDLDGNGVLDLVGAGDFAQRPRPPATPRSQSGDITLLLHGPLVTATTLATTAAGPVLPGQTFDLSSTTNRLAAGGGAVAEGTVTFELDGTAIPACTDVAVDSADGSADCGAVGIAAAGTHELTAVYSGASLLGASTSNVVEQVVDAIEPDCSEQRFSDVSTSHPFAGDICWMDEEGISEGYPGTPLPSFQPGAAVTRQAMSAFLYRLAGSPELADPAESTFSDVGTGHPFFTEVEWMAAEGISEGYAGSPKPSYQPSAPVSRQAMSAFLYRIAGSPDFADPAEATFADVSGSNPFFSEIEWMAAEGISTGSTGSPKPSYQPAAAVSRQAMSAFMHRLADGPGVGI